MAKPVGSGNLSCLLDMGVPKHSSRSQDVVVSQSSFPNFGITVPIEDISLRIPLKDKESQHKGYTMSHGLHGCALGLEIYLRKNSMAALLM